MENLLRQGRKAINAMATTVPLKGVRPLSHTLSERSLEQLIGTIY